MPRLSMLLLAALVAACTPMATTAPAAAPPAPMSSSTSMQPGFPTGATYTTTIAAGDVPASAPADMREGVVGAWEIMFGANGHARVSVNGRQVVDAPFQVNGRELVLTEDSGEFACHSTGRYNWHATETELHLQRIEDPCDGRVMALTAHALVRRP